MQNEIKTFGDVRNLIISTIVGLHSGHIPVERGMAIAANIKVLNDNINMEIQANKLFLATEEKLHKFGTVTRMGRTLINENDDETKLLR